ncbi:DUF2510 domain-containing protein [Herbiconiux sp. CPCC 205763]|uniref:DUF2510 domain-containing protein n=1 Tax=Herbiconiux aconitum TaxID=2970913 RepID=A0ABT2GUM7_9MICO|nr:DUF2510 domain-containing protein [Herbiconiux aconitum]MCS5718591.1 DUF2510 domain-containing protein [Herbiconiux aconitum]
MSHAAPPPPAGWYPDTDQPGNERYWDGTQWTDTRRPVLTAPPPYVPAAPPVKAPGQGLATAALVLGIIGAVFAFIPGVTGLAIVLGLLAAILGGVALMRKTPGRQRAAIGSILGGAAFIVAIVMTIVYGVIGAGAINAAVTSETSQTAPAEPAPTPTEAPEPTSTPTPTPTPTPEPIPEPVAAPFDPAQYLEAADRDYALLVKTPDDHVGDKIVSYGEIIQFDSATGPCQFRASTSGTQKEYSYEYDQNTLIYAGDSETSCPLLDATVQGDIVKMYVTVMGSYSYDTQIGGNTTVPLFQVDGLELLPPTEY